MKPIRFRGKAKGVFFLFRLDRLMPGRILNFFGHMSMLSKWIAKHKKGTYHDFYSWKFQYNKRFDLYEQVIQQKGLDTAIDYLEFGVAGGSSFKWWVNRIKHNDARFYGFDTFTGLPEDWGPFKKGDMGTGNKPPEIDDTRHQYFTGLFQQTLVGFLNNYKPGKRKVIHMDADLYTATLYVLTLITPYLKPGDVIFFDEFNVPLHEFKAFTEWTKSFYINYEVLGGVNNFYQAAFMIK